MRISWTSVAGAAGALIAVKLVAHFYGFAASVVALGALMLAWLGLVVFYRQQLVKIQTHLSGLDEKGRAEVLSRATPEIRRDLERMAAKRRNA